MMIDKATLYGVWDLIAWRRVEPGGAVSYPFTEQAHGRIFYSAGDWMGVYLQKPDWAGSPRDGGYISYSGSFAVEGKSIFHLVDFANQKELVGTRQVREATLAGDVVTLSAPAADGSGARQILQWKRRS